MKKCLQLLLCMSVILLASFTSSEPQGALRSENGNLSSGTSSQMCTYYVHHAWEYLGGNEYEVTVWVTMAGGTEPIEVPISGCLYVDLKDWVPVSLCMNPGQTYATQSFFSSFPVRSEATGTSPTEINGWQICYDVAPTYINY